MDEHGRAASASEYTTNVAALGRFVVSEQSLQEALRRVAEMSVRVVYGADGAGVTWVVAGKPSTVTVSGDFVRRIDEIQYTLDEGPCVQAFRTQQVVLVESLELEKRWARFTAAALGHGLKGVVAVPLTAHGAQLGSLNIYSMRAWAFDEASAGTAALFAEHAAIVLANAEAFSRARTAAVNLGEALTSRAVIDMAKGIVMAQHGYNPDEAFDHLRELSQAQHRKVREVAHDLVDEMSRSRRQASAQPQSDVD